MGQAGGRIIKYKDNIFLVMVVTLSSMKYKMKIVSLEKFYNYKSNLKKIFSKV